MNYRVWCEDSCEWVDAEPTKAASPVEAAKAFVYAVDATGRLFPDENDGDKCTICVCEWEDLDDSADDPPKHQTFTFKLVIDRRVELQR